MSNACRWTCEPARGGHSSSWLCCTWIAQVQCGFPCDGHKTSGVKLPIAELLWTGSYSPLCDTCRAVFPLYHTRPGPCFPLWHRLAGPCFSYATHLRGRVPLMPHTCGAMFPSCHHLQGHVPLMPHTCGPVFPLCHTLVSRIPLMPLTSKVVFPPLCHTLAGPSCQVARTKLTLHFGQWTM